MIKKIRNESVLFKSLLGIAVPIILQSFVTASLNLIDSFMIGFLGENQIASVGLANQYYMVFLLTTIGITGAAGIFMTQFYGRNDKKKILTFTGISLTVSILASILFTGMALFLPEQIMHIFTGDITVTALGTKYLKSVSFSYIFTAVSFSFSVALRSTKQPKIPLYASIIGLACNTFFNWVLIFGNLGLPALGVTGAALGTLMARGAEMFFIISFIYKRKNIIAGSLKEFSRFNSTDLKVYFKTALPVILNDLMWITGISAYSVAYARLGINATATMQIANTINNLFNIFAIGLASAASIILGNKIGAFKEEEARKDAVKISILGTCLGMLSGIILYLTAPAIGALFKVEPDTYKNIVSVLKIMALVAPIRFFGVIQIVGVLRGGGDVIFATATELFSVWGIAVPLSFIGVSIFQIPINIVYLLVCIEEPFKAMLTIPRLISGKWLKRVINDKNEIVESVNCT